MEFLSCKLTTQMEVTVVDSHVSVNPHVAPGPFGVVVRVTALVAGQADLGDELFALTEGRCLR